MEAYTTKMVSDKCSLLSDIDIIHGVTAEPVLKQVWCGDDDGESPIGHQNLFIECWISDYDSC